MAPTLWVLELQQPAPPIYLFSSYIFQLKNTNITKTIDAFIISVHSF